MRLQTGVLSSLLLIAACGQSEDISEPAPITQVDPNTGPGEAETVIAEEITPEQTVIDSAPEDQDLREVQARYDADVWFVGYGWSGEYPTAFTIIEDGVILPARSVPDIETATDMTCPLPKAANIHPWNADRVEKDDLVFVNATKRIPQTVVKAGTVSVFLPMEEDPVNLNLAPGDVVTFDRYYGEGYGAVSYEDVQYELALNDLDPLLDESDPSAYEEHEWVKVTCYDEAKTRAWILRSETDGAAGVALSQIEGFGYASDGVPDLQGLSD